MYLYIPIIYKGATQPASQPVKCLQNVSKCLQNVSMETFFPYRLHQSLIPNVPPATYLPIYFSHLFQFKRMLNKELSHFSESKSGNQISEYICNTFLGEL